MVEMWCCGDESFTSGFGHGQGTRTAPNVQQGMCAPIGWPGSFLEGGFCMTGKYRCSCDAAKPPPFPDASISLDMVNGWLRHNGAPLWLIPFSFLDVEPVASTSSAGHKLYCPYPLFATCNRAPKIARCIWLLQADAHHFPAFTSYLAIVDSQASSPLRCNVGTGWRRIMFIQRLSRQRDPTSSFSCVS